MDLTINRQSHLPIHVQLKAQLTHEVQKLLRKANIDVVGLAPKGTEIMVDNRTLDKGRMEMLRQRLARMASGIEKRGARRARR